MLDRSKLSIWHDIRLRRWMVNVELQNAKAKGTCSQMFVLKDQHGA